MISRLSIVRPSQKKTIFLLFEGFMLIPQSNLQTVYAGNECAVTWAHEKPK
jgi:hypothetical protein